MGQKTVECEALAGVSIDNRRCHAARLVRSWRVVVGVRSLGCRTRAQHASRSTAVARRQLGMTLALLGGGSAAVLFTLAVRVGSIDALGLRPTVETMMTSFALAAAWLLRSEFASSRRLRDLLLFAASLILGLTTLCVAALPAALELPAGAYFSAAQLWGQLAVGAIFAAAAFTPRHLLVVGSIRPGAIAASLGLATLVLAGVGGLLPAAQAHASTGDALGRPLLLILVSAATGTLASAAAAFARRCNQEASRAAALMAIAMSVLAAATLSRLYVQSLHPARIGAGDELSLVGFALILATAVLLERRVRTQLAKSAALAERRRVARDLHDGLAQDLAFIAAHGPSMAQTIGGEHPMVVAARRALAISRDAISELSDPVGATAHESLEAVAQEFRDRFEIKIAVNAGLDRDLASNTREQVTRIAREAIANAVRHGRARMVIVSLGEADNGVALRVVDDGCGIAANDGDPVPEGFGLRSMRERAAALGGQLSVRQLQRGGTELEFVLR